MGLGAPPENNSPPPAPTPPVSEEPSSQGGYKAKSSGRFNDNFYGGGGASNGPGGGPGSGFYNSPGSQSQYQPPPPSAPPPANSNASSSSASLGASDYQAAVENLEGSDEDEGLGWLGEEDFDLGSTDEPPPMASPMAPTSGEPERRLVDINDIHKIAGLSEISAFKKIIEQDGKADAPKRPRATQRNQPLEGPARVARAPVGPSHPYGAPPQGPPPGYPQPGPGSYPPAGPPPSGPHAAPGQGPNKPPSGYPSPPGMQGPPPGAPLQPPGRPGGSGVPMGPPKGPGGGPRRPSTAKYGRNQESGRHKPLNPGQAGQSGPQKGRRHTSRTKMPPRKRGAPKPNRRLVTYLICDIYDRPFKLNPEFTYVIGRDENVSICLPDDSVSRKHATILHEKDQFIIEDARSLNGTYVNGRCITSTRLRSNDVIQIGPFLFRVHAAEEHEAAPECGVSLTSDTRHLPSLPGPLSCRVGPTDISELLLFLNRTARSGVATIRYDRWAGRMFITNGEVVHCRAGKAVGDEALKILLRIEQGYFHFSQEDLRVKRTVNTPTFEHIEMALADVVESGQ